MRLNLPALYTKLEEVSVSSMLAQRVVRRGADGAKVPLTDVMFWRGMSKQAVRHGDMEPMEATVDDAGRFSVPVIIRTAQFEGNASAWVEPVVFLLRSPDCADLIVPFNTDWHERDLIMNCTEQRNPK